ncbi:MAG TPA: hypothetical protein VHK65_14325 [Candidatus Dormibacteraeota bacterium]|nr:hypothetical protein [Candidatus Dormibacteraeota bacterium]
MNELNREDAIRGNAPAPVASLDAQLTELIEFVWTCEAAARREDHIDAVIKYGTN